MGKWGYGFFAAVFFTLFSVMPAWGKTDSAGIDGIERQLRETRRKKTDERNLKGFFYICAYGSREDVEKALVAGADARAGDPAHDRMPPLSVAAAWNPDSRVIRTLLAAGADVKAASGGDNRTALHYAALFSPEAEKVVAALLTADPDIYALDRFQYTALDFAISGRYRNGAFDANPREKLILLLLGAAKRLPFTLPRTDRKSFMTKKLQQYDINMGRGWRDGDVIDAFKSLGADERIMKKQ